MALVKCPECGKEVSSDSKVCPSCGKQLKKPIAPIVLLILSVLMSLWVASVLLIPTTDNYLQAYDQAYFENSYWMLLSIVGSASISGILLLINTKIDSKLLNTIRGCAIRCFACSVRCLHRTQ
ncbi:zinc ribbon domain-containing protein [Candidatus Collinsella stercoripullorum]|uniref:zinc ribbon domain-containing protein n=1 Tax=Candidatus Collinsella stercoripullorum TaxID=2838522 RepID=UPI0022DFD4E7|nr:zinc ribbon domain-containing protein [Candidatus Collinsella stercoripullorum]